MSTYSSLTNNQNNTNNNNINNINNLNIVSQNHLNMSSTFQRRGVRRRWENIRRANQSVENKNRGNVQNNNRIENNNNEINNNNGRSSIGNVEDNNINININEGNNNERNSMIPLNRENNDINNNNNIIHNHNNYNIVNNFNNYDLSGNSINSDSCFLQFRRIRKNYLDRQNFINNTNTNTNNVTPITNSNSNTNTNNKNPINNININVQENNNNINNNIEILEDNNINNNINNEQIDNQINTNETNTNNENNNNEEEEEKVSEIKEDKKEKENNEKNKEIIKEENIIGSEIKDTVKCYICFEKISKPKMCPNCHRMACEKCLYNWFINLKKDKCGFCRLNTNFNQMVSVPFMDAVVNFIEKFFNKKKIEINNFDKEFLEYCPEHENELLYYYCLDCGKAYCKTCFVFFGEEKDKHTGHSIIEYEKYKNMSLPLLKKNLDKLESNIQHVEENIKRCISYKNSYEHQRKVGNIFINIIKNIIYKIKHTNISFTFKLNIY